MPSVSPKPPGSRKSRCMSMIEQRRAVERDGERLRLGGDQGFHGLPLPAPTLKEQRPCHPLELGARAEGFDWTCKWLRVPAGRRQDCAAKSLGAGGCLIPDRFAQASGGNLLWVYNEAAGRPPYSIGRKPSLSSSAMSRSRLGVGRGEQLRAVEDRIGAGEETQRLRLLAHVLAAGRQPHHRSRHGDARHRDGAHEIERIELGARRRSGVPSTCTSMLIGTLSGCTGRLASVAIMPTRSSSALAHADDAAAADMDAGLAHMRRACRGGPDRCAW